jgi:DNA-binding NarL/FixJ family response regulator
MTCPPPRCSHIPRLQDLLHERFPGLESERPLYILDGDADRALREVVSLRATEPDATILALTESHDYLHLKRLLHAGADGVFDDRYADERNALLRAAAIHVARGGPRGGVVAACRALRALLAEWNIRHSLIEVRKGGAA